MPEICIAIVSQKWAKRGRFGDMTKVLHDFFDAQTWLIIGTITVALLATNSHHATSHPTQLDMSLIRNEPNEK